MPIPYLNVNTINQDGTKQTFNLRGKAIMFSLPNKDTHGGSVSSMHTNVECNFFTTAFATFILGFSNCVCSVPAVVHDGVQTMCDCQDRAVLKLGADSHLDQVVCLHVHGRCGLIQNQNFGFPQQSSGQT